MEGDDEREVIRSGVPQGIDTQGHKLTAGVHGSVPKLLTVSDAVWSHARCVYRPSGMSWTPNGTNQVDTKSKPWGVDAKSKPYGRREV
jgi:hypothetical protein